MSDHAAIIYRLIPREAWLAAERAGTFHGSAHDLRDGFIHFSSAAQVRETAAKHYAGQADLLLLHVSVSALEAPLRWEISRNGELFPHLYGSLPVRAVHRVEAVPLGDDGVHRFDATNLGRQG
ncbi:MAG: DUF952 domain-containing protein [Myxococcota bacterium]|jgi:uncharacterized protein (DUF952 family)|nr:DUF952 domain-containing protein [Myxococcota bacterium]